jgi:hypothetical protein
VITRREAGIPTLLAGHQSFPNRLLLARGALAKKLVAAAVGFPGSPMQTITIE